MIYVFDSSFIAALIIPDERDPHSDRMYTKIKNEDEKHTPQLLWYEITNIFKNLLRRKRYTYEEVLQFFPLLSSIRLITDFETDVNYSKKILNLCNNYNLTSYDAAYLELAERKKAVLCTLDENLIIAAKKHNVAFLNVV
ncbi:MAG: type II toxin-antitoxin system VapC family toxin [Treponema sp.]|jgi:predicted nucleic acid-binding protein|nr:type II toxin-antitoxin system VapC family toxin [Treponema sp.]